MRVKLWNRFIIAFTGIVLLAAGVLTALCSLGFTPSWLDLSWLESGLVMWQRALLCAVGILLCLLGIHNVCMLFARKNTKGFILQRTDYGDMSISMKALDTMARKCVNQHQELEIKSTKIYRVKNGIAVQIRLLLETGVNIPLTVSALQKQIKQYIVSCSGVDVHEVRVLVETSQPKEKKHEKQKEIVVDNRKPDVVPEPVMLQKEAPVEVAPEIVEETPLEEVAEVTLEEEVETKIVVERQGEEVAEEIADAEENAEEESEVETATEEAAEENLFAGFETFAEEENSEEIPAEADKEDEE